MFDFKVKPDDGDEYDLTATSRDIVQWETSGRGRSMKRLMDNLAMTDLYQVAWVAAVRTGCFQGSADDFTRSVDLTMAPDDEDDADDDRLDPTRPGR